MGYYEELGVKRVINAWAHMTTLGGSVMPSCVVEAMVEASKSFVDLDDLQRKVGERIAELTNNQATYITSGANAGLTIATAAVITGKDPAKIRGLPDTDAEVIIHRAHRNPHDNPFRLTGAKFVEIGFPFKTERWELEAAVTERTAAIAYVLAGFTSPGALPLEEVLRVAEEVEVPVIVDAAAQLPPVENLWKFTREMGADIAVFSGGKDLRGPQSTGLVFGSKEIVEACILNSNPKHGIGRALKVGKEEMIGLLAAVEWYLGLDHEKREKECEEMVRFLTDNISPLPHVASAERDFPNESDQPIPRALITFDSSEITDLVVERLRYGTPSIEVHNAKGGILLNPLTLFKGEEEVVSDRLKEILGDL